MPPVANAHRLHDRLDLHGRLHRELSVDFDHRHLKSSRGYLKSLLEML